MNPQLRDAIGKVLYEATVDLNSEYNPTWDWLLNKEVWRLRAEKVVEVYNAQMRKDLEQQLGIRNEEG